MIFSDRPLNEKILTLEIKSTFNSSCEKVFIKNKPVKNPIIHVIIKVYFFLNANFPKFCRITQGLRIYILVRFLFNKKRILNHTFKRAY